MERRRGDHGNPRGHAFHEGPRDHRDASRGLKGYRAPGGSRLFSRAVDLRWKRRLPRGEAGSASRHVVIRPTANFYRAFSKLRRENLQGRRSAIDGLAESLIACDSARLGSPRDGSQCALRHLCIGPVGPRPPSARPRAALRVDLSHTASLMWVRPRRMRRSATLTLVLRSTLTCVADEGCLRATVSLERGVTWPHGLALHFAYRFGSGTREFFARLPCARRF